MQQNKAFRLGLAATALAASNVFIFACGDDDPEDTTPEVDAGPRPPAHIPNPIETVPDPVKDAGPDVPVTSLYPTPLDRNMSARDASLEASVKYCSATDVGVGQFCWDFGGDDGITGWQESFADGGTLALVGTTGDPMRALQAKVTKESGQGPKWVALRYTINVDDIPDAAAGLTLSFSFHIAAVQTYAVIGALQIGAVPAPALRGVAVYPDGCRGYPCIGETAFDKSDKTNWRPFDSSKWYRARIQLVPTGFGTGTIKWSSIVTVGDAIVAQHTDDALPVGTSFPNAVNLFVGAYDTTIAGSNQVEIDDILVE